MTSRASIAGVIPTLDSAATLDATLLSLRNQDGVTPQLVAADSGSTDATLEICARWNLPVIQVERGNMYRAVNAGLRGFATEWVFYLNSDDVLYGDALARLIETGERENADLVYGECDYIDERGRFLRSFSAAKPAELLPLFRAGILGFAQPAAIFRRRTFEALGGFDEQFRLSADADFFQRIVLSGARVALTAGAPVAAFRVHERQLSTTRAALMEDEKRAIRKRAGGAPFGGRVAAWRWKLANLPHYAVRVLRASLMSGRVRMPRSLES